MRKGVVAGGLLIGLTSSLAFAQPEDLLPDIFNDPPPEAPAPTPTPRATVKSVGPVPSVEPVPNAPVVQPIPGGAAPVEYPPAALPEDFPTLEELEEMEDNEINELFGLRPRFDVPETARRALSRIGVIARNEGGFPSQSLASQPAALVRAALEGTRGPLVSRWGHILLRRALASRMDAPDGMDAVEFAALRAALLNRMGEAQVARALVQDVDGGNYDPALADAAFDAYLATGDVLGICPITQLHAGFRDDGEWILAQAICNAYRGDTRAAERRLDRALWEEEAPEIDIRLAQRFAGAAGDAGRAVNIEWGNVEELSPWRFALSRALGEEIPDNLLAPVQNRFAVFDATIPATPLVARIAAADRAAERGILSSAAMVDLYSQLYASDTVTDGDRQPGIVLREAYVAEDPYDRLAAMQSLWGDQTNYGRLVLTSYAAARMPVSDALIDNADVMLTSMLAAGLDANARRWSGLVEEGSLGWALLSLSDPTGGAVNDDAVASFIADDTSEDARKSRFLLAGLAGLGRLERNDVERFSSDLGINLLRNSAWSDRISAAGRYRNAALVALLAGVGMQGDDWSRMTARQLYHIVSALDAAGLSAEARMIAAEAVARG